MKAVTGWMILGTVTLVLAGASRADAATYCIAEGNLPASVDTQNRPLMDT